MHNVFVYGSLKRGFGNNRLLQQCNAEFIMETVTADTNYHMFPVCRSFPGVLDGGSCSIQGELYRVNDEGLRALDMLESNGSLYLRKQIKLEDFDEPAWMYFFLHDRDTPSEWGQKRVSISEMLDRTVANWL